MKGWIALGAVAVLIVIAALAMILLPSPAKAPTDGAATSTTPASLDDLIVVTSPLPGATVSSPLTITGRARGTWYFEASFPVVLTDWDGRIIAQAPAQATADWMTEDYVPFSVTLTFDTPTSSPSVPDTGALILKNDNPSGDPARDKSLEIPVVFK